MKKVLIAIIAMVSMGLSAAYGQQKSDTLNRSRQRQQSDLYRHDASGLHSQPDTTVTETNSNDSGDGANMQPNSTSGTSATQYQTDQGTTGTGGQSDSGTDDDADNMQFRPDGHDEEHSDSGKHRKHSKESKGKNEKHQQADQNRETDNN